VSTRWGEVHAGIIENEGIDENFKNYISKFLSSKYDDDVPF